MPLLQSARTPFLRRLVHPARARRGIHSNKARLTAYCSLCLHSHGGRRVVGFHWLRDLSIPTTLRYAAEICRTHRRHAGIRQIYPAASKMACVEAKCYLQNGQQSRFSTFPSIWRGLCCRDDSAMAAGNEHPTQQLPAGYFNVPVFGVEQCKG